jgi:hypothetical protein
MKRQPTQEIKVEKTTTKIEPLCGGIEARFKRCGKPNCKCAKGQLHGPYYLRRWQKRGKRYSQYVKKSQLSATIEACSEYKQDRKETRALIKGMNDAGNSILRAMRELLRSSGGPVFKLSKDELDDGWGADFEKSLDI